MNVQAKQHDKKNLLLRLAHFVSRPNAKANKRYFQKMIFLFHLFLPFVSFCKVINLLIFSLQQDVNATTTEIIAKTMFLNYFQTFVMIF